MYLYNYPCILPELTQGNVKMMKIEDVVKIVEEGHAWIAARVVALNVGARDRYYKGCGNCGKKVDTAPKGIYECGQYQHTGDDFKFKKWEAATHLKFPRLCKMAVVISVLWMWVMKLLQQRHLGEECLRSHAVVPAEQMRLI